MRDRLLPAGLLILALFTASTLILTQPVINQVKKEVLKSTRIMAQLFSGLILSAIEEKSVADVLKEGLKDIDFPVIVTDHMGIPRAWKNINIDPNRFSARDLERPEKLKNDPEYRKLLWTLGRLSRLHPPVEILKDGEVVGYIYYGDPPILNYLRVLPFLLLSVAILSFLGLFWAAKSIQTYQLETLWVNFAKGLAHQMGTPVSSLYGWYEYLKLDPGVDQSIVEEMGKDLERMKSILRRFSKIGNGGKLQEVNLKEMIEETVEELRKRFLKDIEITMDLDDNAIVFGDRELLSWAVENLLKNAYEARRDENPKIRIELKRKGDRKIIRVIDNGKGIPKDKRKFLFKKSFTTKEKGWGMGLVLTRRIIEDTHGGKIRLKKSEPLDETIFEIEL